MAECMIPVPSAELQHRPRAEGHALVSFSSSQEVYCQPVAALTAEESETCWLGRFRDVSAGGLNLILRRRFEPGTSLIIKVSGKSKRGARSFSVQVVHATPEGKGRWIIACEFISTLSKEELQALAGE